MLGWLCIVQSLCAYTPGILAGLNVGLPPLVQARMLAVSHTKPLHDAVAQMADDLYGGYAPATPFSENIKVYRQTEAAEIRRRLYYLSEISDTVMSALQLRAVIFYEIVIENYSSFKRFYAEVFVYCVCAVKLCARHHKRNESQYAVAYLRIVT